MLPENALPVMGTWFWWDKEFEAEGYRAFIDHAADDSPFNVLTTSIRAAKEVTDSAVNEHIRLATEYAKERGIGIAMDLDARLARSAFMEKYPDELQEMLRLREVEPDSPQPTNISIESAQLTDHYTMDHTPYYATAGRLERVYSYIRDTKGIKSNTVCDITAQCKVLEASPVCVNVQLPNNEQEAGRTVCVIAAFTHFTPDVFAPHLLDYQREVLELYKDIPLAGACKDEWGFPPCFDGCPEKNDFWFSSHYADAYRNATNGRDLVADCLLMYAGEVGREDERQAAINQFMKMAYIRNGEIEADFYDAIKEIWGPSALVCTHPTWWPIPDSHEFKKNGLHWWQAKRDLAQTDEITPLCVRTALAKKWGSAAWYNMFYSSDKKDYNRELWSNSLAGGRVNYHPVYPDPKDVPLDAEHTDLFQGKLMQGENRVRLLNFITKTPLDCPVAVVFGHACAMNWTGPSYDDVGLALANALWQEGYPADLIPTSEIANGSLVVDDNGYIRYGMQRYSALVLYHPEYEGDNTAEFIEKASNGRTALYSVGNWASDFYGKPFDSKPVLDKTQQLPEIIGEAAAHIISYLQSIRIEQQVKSVDTKNAVWYHYTAPPIKGDCRLIDGTRIFVSASCDVAGDPICDVLSIGNHSIEVDAVGLVAVRFDSEDRIDAMAAGGLSSFRGGGLDIKLNNRLDVALWKNDDGTMQGVVQGVQGDVPASLAKITSDWTKLRSL